VGAVPDDQTKFGLRVKVVGIVVLKVVAHANSTRGDHDVTLFDPESFGGVTFATHDYSFGGRALKIAQAYFFEAVRKEVAEPLRHFGIVTIVVRRKFVMSKDPNQRTIISVRTFDHSAWLDRLCDATGASQEIGARLQ